MYLITSSDVPLEEGIPASLITFKGREGLEERLIRLPTKRHDLDAGALALRVLPILAVDIPPKVCKTDHREWAELPMHVCTNVDGINPRPNPEPICPVRDLNPAIVF